MPPIVVDEKKSNKAEMIKNLRVAVTVESSNLIKLFIKDKDHKELLHQIKTGSPYTRREDKS